MVTGGATIGATGGVGTGGTFWTIDGDVVGSTTGSGNGAARLSRLAIFRMAFCVVSPSCSVGKDGGSCSSEMMSDDACLRKSSNVTLGKGTIVGKN